MPVSLKGLVSYLGLQQPIKGRSSGNAQKPVCFSATLEDRHKIDDGSEYLHFIFGAEKDRDPDCGNIGVVDAEFIFLASEHSESSYQPNLLPHLM